MMKWKVFNCIALIIDIIKNHSKKNKGPSVDRWSLKNNKGPKINHNNYAYIQNLNYWS